MTNDVVLNAGDKSLALPVVEAMEGNNGYDVSALLKETGDTTFDIGFANTAVCKSAITYIDGDAGILRYRGYPIDQLAAGSTFLESAYLVLYGELPTAEQLQTFEQRIAAESKVDDAVRDMFRVFAQSAHPMQVLASSLMALTTFNGDVLDVEDAEQVETATIRLLAQLPILAAYAYRNSVGEPLLESDPSLGYVENFLYLVFGSTETDPKMVRALNTLFILHADHEQNCSTSTVRLVGSAKADLFTSIVGGVNALSGPLHGGANQQVVEMLSRIEAAGGDVDSFVTSVKNKEKGAKLMGFGHRVYKNYDPRAAIVKKHADEILRGNDEHDELLDIALRLEGIALEDEYFKQRKLYPNVDFYTGLIYKAMGFPVNMFTVLFALGRLPGWIAHWREMNTDPANKIGRPRQIYIGETERAFVDMDKR